MTQVINEASPLWWPAEAADCYEDLASYRLVGASACADRITAALVSVVVESEHEQRNVCADMTEAARMFCSLKPDTALYRNLGAVLSHAAETGRAAGVLEAGQALSNYRRAAQDSVVANAGALLENADTVLVHDYSSIMLRILEVLAAERPRRIVVTAGEPLGQGPRVARLAAAAGHHIIYCPDMSVGRVIEGVDTFITGVESFYADGSLANTVGTRMLSLLCRETGVPVVAPTELLKYDRDRATVADAELGARLLHPWPGDKVEQSDQWNAVQLVLDPVPASLITSFVTESGVFRPSEVGAIAEAEVLITDDRLPHSLG